MIYGPTDAVQARESCHAEWSHCECAQTECTNPLVHWMVPVTVTDCGARPADMGEPTPNSAPLGWPIA